MQRCGMLLLMMMVFGRVEANGLFRDKLMFEGQRLQVISALACQSGLEFGLVSRNPDIPKCKWTYSNSLFGLMNDPKRRSFQLPSWKTKKQQQLTFQTLIEKTKPSAILLLWV